MFLKCFFKRLFYKLVSFFKTKDYKTAKVQLEKTHHHIKQFNVYDS